MQRNRMIPIFIEHLKKAKVLVTQSRLILCNPMHHSLPGSSAHGILQTRILEWVSIPFSRGYSQTRDRTSVSCIAGGFFPIRVTSEAHWASTMCQVLLMHNICKTLLNLILLRRFWSDVYDHHFANGKKKVRFTEVKPLCQCHSTSNCWECGNQEPWQVY